MERTRVRVEALQALNGGLTQEQQLAVIALRWLMGADRGAGKTYAIATAIVDESLATGRPIALFDHWNGARPNLRFVADQIQRICKTRGLDVEISATRQTARVSRRDEIRGGLFFEGHPYRDAL